MRHFVTSQRREQGQEGQQMTSAEMKSFEDMFRSLEREVH